MDEEYSAHMQFSAAEEEPCIRPSWAVFEVWEVGGVRLACLFASVGLGADPFRLASVASFWNPAFVLVSACVLVVSQGASPGAAEAAAAAVGTVVVARSADC